MTRVDDEAEDEVPEPVAASGLSADTVRELQAAGLTVIDTDSLDTIRAAATDGQQARAQQRTEERDRFLGAALQAGKFAPARLSHWQHAYDADPDGARATVDALAPGLVPLTERGHAGDANTDPEANEFAAARARRFGRTQKGA